MTVALSIRSVNSTILSTFVLVLVTIFALAGCGGSSSSGIDESVCKQDLTYSGVAPDMWTGCYSSDSADNAIWEAACKLESVDVSKYVYLHFGVSSTCNFDWVRAEGEVGDTWQALAASSANWSSSEFVINHTGAKVHELKLCVNGVSGGPPDWCK
jgi:hypothetical protein